MQLRTVVVGADRSPDGRQAVEIGTRLAQQASGRVTIVEVVRVASEAEIPPGRSASSPGGKDRTAELVEFENWLGKLPPHTPGLSREVAVRYGIPGIEIGRVADDRHSDLIVLGRRPRSPDQPLLLGETADAVVRRSGRPVLFVPHSTSEFRRLLVALDGSDRTLALLRPTAALSRALGATMSAITVRVPDGSYSGEETGRVAAALDRLSGPRVELMVRSGNPIDEILAAVQESRSDLLVIGYRRGGPPKVIGPADIARNLLYASPSAVLTIPL